MGRRGRKTQRQALFREENSNHQPPPHETNTRMMERMDWSSPPELVLAMISNFLLSEDVTEYIRFRAVCRGWRRSTAPPSNIKSIFHPRNWIMIISGQRANNHSRWLKDWTTFLHVSSGRCLRVDIRQFCVGYIPISSADGLLVLFKKRRGELCLLHPFTLSLTELPKVDSLLSIFQATLSSFSIRDELSSVNILSSSIVVFFFQRYGKVVFARISGNSWIDTDYEVSCISTLPFQGQLYAVEKRTGEVLLLELEEATIGPSLDPKLNVTTRIPIFSYPFDHGGLLVSGGQMLLLLKYQNVAPLWGIHFEVYEIDVGNRRLIPTTIPRDRTIFASGSRCLSLSSSVSPSIFPQSIYYYKRGDSGIIVYNSLRPNLAPTNSYYSHPEPSLELHHWFICHHTSRYPKKYFGPYTLPYHLICYCANFIRAL